MLRPAVYLAVAGTLLVTGIAQGILGGRWNKPLDAVALQATLDRVPLHIKGWDGTSLGENESDPSKTRTSPEILRRYVNRVDGSVVTIYLTGGRPGPIVAGHSPESCYPGAGYEIVAAPHKHTIATPGDARSHEFLIIGLSKRQRAIPDHLRLFWAYTGDGTWQSPKYPRLTCAKYRQLYKLYVIRQLVKPEPLEGDVAFAFMQTFLPELNKALFAGSAE